MPSSMRFERSLCRKPSPCSVFTPEMNPRLVLKLNDMLSLSYVSLPCLYTGLPWTVPSESTVPTACTSEESMFMMMASASRSMF